MCGLIPLILGSTAFFGWLISTGGKSDGGKAFQLLGVIVLGSSPAPLAIGLIALFVARRRGAAARPLRARALLLFTNIPLAALYFMGVSVAAIQRVEVVNLSGRPVEGVKLTACRSATCEVGALADSERYVWRFTPPSEGTLSVTGLRAGQVVALEGACMFFVFTRFDVTLTLRASGEWDARQEEGAPWSWLPWN